MEGITAARRHHGALRPLELVTQLVELFVATGARQGFGAAGVQALLPAASAGAQERRDCPPEERREAEEEQAKVFALVKYAKTQLVKLKKTNVLNAHV